MNAPYLTIPEPQTVPDTLSRILADKYEEVRARSDYVSRFAVTEGVLDILGEFTGGDCEEEASRHRGE